MNLNELRDRAYKNAVAHGWHGEDKSHCHWLCLVISELMEAVEADRKGKKLIKVDLILKSNDTKIWLRNL